MLPKKRGRPPKPKNVSEADKSGKLSKEKKREKKQESKNMKLDKYFKPSPTDTLPCSQVNIFAQPSPPENNLSREIDDFLKEIHPDYEPPVIEKKQSDDSDLALLFGFHHASDSCHENESLHLAITMPKQDSTVTELPSVVN